MTQAGQVKALMPVDLGAAKIRYARGMRAGPWIFATGQMAQDFTRGIDPAVLAAAAPHYGVPRHEREAARISDNIGERSRAGRVGGALAFASPKIAFVPNFILQFGIDHLSNILPVGLRLHYNIEA